MEDEARKLKKTAKTNKRTEELDSKWALTAEHQNQGREQKDRNPSKTLYNAANKFVSHNNANGSNVWLDTDNINGYTFSSYQVENSDQYDESTDRKNFDSGGATKREKSNGQQSTEASQSRSWVKEETLCEVTGQSCSTTTADGNEDKATAVLQVIDDIIRNLFEENVRQSTQTAAEMIASPDITGASQLSSRAPKKSPLEILKTQSRFDPVKDRRWLDPYSLKEQILPSVLSNKGLREPIAMSLLESIKESKPGHLLPKVHGKRSTKLKNEDNPDDHAAYLNDLNSTGNPADYMTDYEFSRYLENLHNNEVLFPNEKQMAYDHDIFEPYPKELTVAEKAVNEKLKQKNIELSRIDKIQQELSLTFNESKRLKLMRQKQLSEATVEAINLSGAQINHGLEREINSYKTTRTTERTQAYDPEQIEVSPSGPTVIGETLFEMTESLLDESLSTTIAEQPLLDLTRSSLDQLPSAEIFELENDSEDSLFQYLEEDFEETYQRSREVYDELMQTYEASQSFDIYVRKKISPTKIPTAVEDKPTPPKRMTDREQSILLHAIGQTEKLEEDVKSVKNDKATGLSETEILKPEKKASKLSGFLMRVKKSITKNRTQSKSSKTQDSMDDIPVFSRDTPNLLDIKQQFSIELPTIRFQYLSLVTRPEAGTTCVYEQNLLRNLNQNVVCYDHTRVKLQCDTEEERQNYDSNYIHANYVHGYNQMRRYICCQAPFPGGIKEFWKMVWQTDSRVIVIIASKLQEDRFFTYAYFPLPEEGSRIYGIYKITYLDRRSDEKYTITVYSIRNSTTGEIRRIYQMRFDILWPGLYPSTTFSILNFIQQVRQCQATANLERLQNDSAESLDPPIVLHSNIGLDDTGLFTCLDICMQMMDDIGMVNVMEVVKTIMQQRAAIFDHFYQYLFCYHALLDYAVMRGYLPKDTELDW